MTSDMHMAGHLTVLGWTTFALYLIAALLCFRAAIRRPSSVVISPSTRGGQWSSDVSRTWLCLGVILAVLGLNKPVDVQTRLIKLGRYIAGSENLLGHRDALRAIFFTGFILAIIALLAVVLFHLRLPIEKFARHSPMAAIGSGMVCIYIMLRAISIDHVDQMLGFDLERIPYLWLLEAGGLMFIMIQALHMPKAQTRMQKNSVGNNL